MEHILFQCEKYEAERWNLLRKLKRTTNQLTVEILKQKSEFIKIE